MTKLRLGPIADDKPVKLTIEFQGPVYRNLQAYAALMKVEEGAADIIDPARLIVPMVERFMATDRAFLKLRKSNPGARAADRPSTTRYARPSDQAS